MKKRPMRKTIIACLAALLAVNAALPAQYIDLRANAEMSGVEIKMLEEGSIGESLIWSLDENGVMEISGKGDMGNYNPDDVPWLLYRELIKEVVIREGVTGVGDNTFAECEALERVYIADSVKRIGQSAFAGCTNLAEVTMNPSDRLIVENAFEGTEFYKDYYTTATLPGMNKGAAGTMRGKQLVINVFVDEVVGENGGEFTISNSWQPDTAGASENNPVLLDRDNVYKYLTASDTDKTYLPQNPTDSANKPVTSTAIEQRLTALNNVFAKLEKEADAFKLDDETTMLEFVNGPSYFFTYQAVNGAASLMDENGAETVISPSQNGTSFMEQLLQLSSHKLNLKIDQNTKKSQFIDNLLKEQEYDGVLFLFHHNAPDGTSTVFAEGTYEEVSVLYSSDEADIEKRILGAYGATEDENGIPTAVPDGDHNALKMYNGALRNPSGPKDHVRPLTAFVRGWNTQIEKDVFNLMKSGMNVSPLDMDMDGTLSEKDEEIIVAYLKKDKYAQNGSDYLTPFKRMLIGSGLTVMDSNIKGWTDQISVERWMIDQDSEEYSYLVDNRKDDFNCVKFVNKADGSCIMRPCNDLNFDGVVTTGDQEIYGGFSSADGSNFVQSMMFYHYNLREEKSPRPYKFGVDTWRFSNSKSFFGNTYSMLGTENEEGTHAYMVDQLTAGIYPRYDINRYYMDGTFVGSCYGMCVTSLLAYYGVFDPAMFDSSASNLYQLGAKKYNYNYDFLDEDLESFINYYQASQDFPKQRKIETLYPSLMYSDPIQGVLACLEDGSPTIISVEIPKGYHAIVGYDIKYGNYSYDNNEYDAKILIYDPNHPEGGSDWCLYFRTDDMSMFCIPGYNAYSHNDTFEINDAMDSLSIINDNGLLNGKMTVFRQKKRAVANVSTTAEEYVVALGTVPSINGTSIAPDNITTDDSSIYYMEDGDASYYLQNATPNPFNVQMNYENCTLKANASNGSSVVFSPKGKIELSGKNTDFELEMDLNPETKVTDWNTMTIKGKKSAGAVFEMVDCGYLLTCSNLSDIEVICTSLGISADVNFTTDYDKVFLHEIDKYTIGVSVDKDGDGEFETLIAKSAEGVTGDLNNDKEFTVLDLVAMNQWLLSGDGMLINSEYGDITKDGVLDGFDLAAMKRMILTK